MFRTNWLQTSPMVFLMASYLLLNLFSATLTVFYLLPAHQINWETSGGHSSCWLSRYTCSSWRLCTYWLHRCTERLLQTHRSAFCSNAIFSRQISATSSQPCLHTSTGAWKHGGDRGDGEGLGLLRGMQKIALLEAEWKCSVPEKCVTIRDNLNWTPLQRCEVEFLSLSTDRKGWGGYEGCEEGGLWL